MTIEQLTPAQREEVQVWMLRRHAQLRQPKGTRRRTDGAGPVKRYDSKGRLKAPT